jgi:hypothetical protein
MDLVAEPEAVITKRRKTESESPIPEDLSSLTYLVTSSIETLKILGLTHLRTLIYGVNISPLTKNPHDVAVSYDYVMEAVLSQEMDTATATNLQGWARNMLTYNLQATDILTETLRHNPALNVVQLQIQPNVSIPCIIHALGSLQNLQALAIRGSDIWLLSPYTSVEPTETVLYILGHCQHLVELTYQTIPNSKLLPMVTDPFFKSPIRKLDLSAVNQRSYRGGGMLLICLQVQRIVARCPNLEWLALPQCLMQDTFNNLACTLPYQCQKLYYVALEGSNLQVPQFRDFLHSITTLTHLVLKDCEFDAIKNFAHWTTGVWNGTIRLKTLEIQGWINPEQASALFSMMPRFGQEVRTVDRWTWTHP